MAYERLDKKYVAGQVWDEAAISHIDNSFDRVYGDLYDDKITVDYEVAYSTVPNIMSPPYEKFWNTAEFSGWWGYAGKPQNFSRIKFPIQGRNGYNLTSVTVKVLEMPSSAEVTAGAWGVTPSPLNWKVLAEQTVSFTEPLSTDKPTIVTADFDNMVENASGKGVFLAILGNARCSMGYCLVRQDDIEYNPWIYYAVDGRAGCGALSGAGYTYDFNSKNILTMVAEFSRKSSEYYYSEIGTSKKDKFFNLVNENNNFGRHFTVNHRIIVIKIITIPAKFANTAISSFPFPFNTFSITISKIPIAPILNNKLTSNIINYLPP